MTDEEKEAIVDLKEILKEWQKIVDIKDPTEREIEMSMYIEEMPFYQIKTLLNLIEKKQNKIASQEKQIKLMQNCDLAKVIKEQEKEIEQLANGIRVLGTNPDITTEEIIKEFTEKPISEEYMKEFKGRYISKDKIIDKIEQIDKEYYTILESNDKEKQLDYINIVSAQHNSMKIVLEEILKEN